jgi:hypothetical protein
MTRETTKLLQDEQGGDKCEKEDEWDGGQLWRDCHGEI